MSGRPTFPPLRADKGKRSSVELYLRKQFTKISNCHVISFCDTELTTSILYSSSVVVAKQWPHWAIYQFMNLSGMLLSPEWDECCILNPLITLCQVITWHSSVGHVTQATRLGDLLDTLEKLHFRKTVFERSTFPQPPAVNIQAFEVDFEVQGTDPKMKSTHG